MPKPPRRSTSRPGSARPSAGFGSQPVRAKRVARQPLREPFLQRNRTRLLWAAAAIAVLAVGGLLYFQATAPAYACRIEWTASSTPSPAPSATPRLGYLQDDMGHDHVNPGTLVRYLYCPPASGQHFDAQGQGPITPKLYGPGDRALPQGWIHNLEHGGLVLLYRCPGDAGDACPDAGQAALQQFWADFPASPVCNIPPHTLSPVIARFDDMAYPYAAIVWDVVLPLETLDTDQILAFFAQQGDRTNPEPQCSREGPSPSAEPSAEPSAAPSEAAPSAPPASDVPSPSAAPAAS